MVATDSGGGVNIANNPKRAGSAIEQKKKFYVCTRAKSNVLNSEWVIRPDETDKLINWWKSGTARELNWGSVNPKHCPLSSTAARLGIWKPTNR